MRGTALTIVCIAAGLTAGCSPERTPDEQGIDAAITGDGAVPRPDATVSTPDAAVFTPLDGIYDESLTPVSDSCATQWTTRTFVTVVTISATTITFSNSGGMSMHMRTGPMTFGASIGSSVFMGMFTTTGSYEITSTYSYTDTGRSCTAVFRILGIRRP
ncbi:MAG: hypothetical protein IT370_15140 [Deltaproteobacteria bacterium]|nr:hypothetical protein [Deltaproteobacteria bacterium]